MAYVLRFCTLFLFENLGKLKSNICVNLTEPYRLSVYTQTILYCNQMEIQLCVDYLH